MIRLCAFSLAIAAIAGALWHYIGTRPKPPASASKFSSTREKNPAPQEQAMISKEMLRQIIQPTPFAQTDKNIFFIRHNEETYQVTTTIDIYLQEYLLSLMKKLKRMTRGKPQRIALVVMEADTGNLLGMAGFDLEDPNANPCIAADFPAASLFKIITAAAAVETLGYTPDTRLYFNGNKYTLYRRQLREIRNKYSYKISFARAFAESVNPVFGKIGKNHLGREKLQAYADAFGFNQFVDSEIKFYSGVFSISEKEYHLAEIGCGFNNDTTVSPLFAAMMTNAVINSGRIMIPSIVEHVTRSDGEIIYKNTDSTYKIPIQPETASSLVRMMQTTITRGTARKSFRGSTRDKVLSGLIIGGKTGSLYNRNHTVKYDWFTGFGKNKKSEKKIILSIVVGHRKYIGTRAATYARMILKEYFKPDHDMTAQR